ncbi:MAG: DUF711 family protein [Gemmatimonadetes bacterium]|nr:DUF711 family protein [Gemmatimonadota bacterium]
MLTDREILSTLEMLENENLDVRTVTLGINLLDCAGSSLDRVKDKIYSKIAHLAQNLVPECDRIGQKYGIPVVNKRIAVSPIAVVGAALSSSQQVEISKALNAVAQEVNVDFIGGFSALVQKGIARGDRALIEAIPHALAATERVCASVNVATTRAGINMDAVLLMGRVIRDLAYRTRKAKSIGAAKLVTFANIPEDNPFMAGATVGWGEGEATINVGVSGPGVVRSVVAKMKDADLGALAEEIKKTAFKITRMGELIGQEVSKALGVRFGIVDLSLAPTPLVGDSIASILEEMGLESCGAPGSTAALALLNDAVKKGGAFASSRVGGLSGAFIPYSEDAGMVAAVERGSLTIEKLEAMTSVTRVSADGNDLEVALEDDAGSNDFLASLVSSGIRLRRFAHVEPSLQQIFIERVVGTQLRPRSAPPSVDPETGTRADV